MRKFKRKLNHANQVVIKVKVLQEITVNKETVREKRGVKAKIVNIVHKRIILLINSIVLIKLYNLQTADRQNQK